MIMMYLILYGRQVSHHIGPYSASYGSPVDREHSLPAALELQVEPGWVLSVVQNTTIQIFWYQRDVNNKHFESSLNTL